MSMTDSTGQPVTPEVEELVQELMVDEMVGDAAAAADDAYALADEFTTEGLTADADEAESLGDELSDEAAAG